MECINLLMVERWVGGVDEGENLAIDLRAPI